MEEYVIAIIDDGVMVSEGLEFNISITGQGKAEPFPVVGTERNLSHGTICYAVIKEHCPESRIGSICIMETDGLGDAMRLVQAIRWCISQRIKFIHMSIGSEEMKDAPMIRKACLEYFQAGGILVAASSNAGNITIPANFSFVFGVQYSLGLEEGKFCLQEAEDDADILLGAVTHIAWKKRYACAPCNSYTSPAFTAMLYCLMIQAKDKNVFEVRREILSKNMDFSVRAVQPDFIDSAVIVGQKGNGKEEYFFKALPIEYLWEDDKNKVNLVVYPDTKALDKINRFADKVNMILYVGKMPLEMQSWCNQSHIPYWDEDSGKAAVWKKVCKARNMMQQEDFSIGSRREKPIIINMRGIEGFGLLHELKKRFALEGYNVFTLSTQDKSYLYGINKIPLDYQMLKGYLSWLFEYGKLDIVFVDSLLLREKDADLILEGKLDFKGVLCQEPYVYMSRHASAAMAGHIFDVMKKILS
ncbi:MAG: hypothetical protein HFH39_09470 [Lachnospiraceae bacterium]|nr:hypothetical protein [Lachnospiraceae bacterium]